MITVKVILLVSSLALLYTWAGYPALLFAIRKTRKRQSPQSGSPLASVSVIIAVHNEESQIAAKLEDCLALECPREQLEIIVASDGSNDRTAAIVEEFAKRDPRIRLLDSEGRRGKSGAQN